MPRPRQESSPPDAAQVAEVCGQPQGLKAGAHRGVHERRATGGARDEDARRHAHERLGDGEPRELLRPPNDVHDDGREPPEHEPRDVKKGNDVPMRPERADGPRGAQAHEERVHKERGARVIERESESDKREGGVGPQEPKEAREPQDLGEQRRADDPRAHGDAQRDAQVKLNRGLVGAREPPEPRRGAEDDHEEVHDLQARGEELPDHDQHHAGLVEQKRRHRQPPPALTLATSNSLPSSPVSE